ncbi:predicted protein [Nematostella vectensis]|uniref:DNA excision repair protein ERCC-8 n=1 Tax=Nematostella vectensis TaxID=45351 RepID=A7SIS6_NEMVE|nr:DNA excision repair protein ERCC-8 [Nematostella vectensis]EDO36406.1 predicted protein [Nematostella vectensis]|eukprot:XP_001628469.1 predicted protein [Nematostella vectensis]
MLQCLSNRELGIDPARYLPKIEKSRRIYALSLSQTGDIEQVHNGGINSIDIEDGEGRYLISCSTNSKIVIHDTEVGYYKSRFKCEAVAKVTKTHKGNHRSSIETVQWYPHDSGMFLTSSVDRTLKVWDTNALQVVETFNFEGIVYKHQAAKCAKRHSLVAAANEDSRVYLCDLRTGSASHILRGHATAVLSVSWSPLNQYLLATGGRDNKVLLWDVRKAVSCLTALDQHNGKEASGSCNTRTAHNGHINSICFTSDGLNILSYGTDNRLRLWDTFTGKNTLVNYGRLENPSNKAIQCATSEGNLSEVVFVPNLGSINIYDIHSGKRISSLVGHYNKVNCCSFQHDYQVLYSGSFDCHLLSWLPDMERLKEEPKEDKSFDEKIKQAAPVDPYQDTWSSDED